MPRLAQAVALVFISPQRGKLRAQYVLQATIALEQVYLLLLVHVLLESTRRLLLLFVLRVLSVLTQRQQLRVVLRVQQELIKPPLGRPHASHVLQATIAPRRDFQLQQEHAVLDLMQQDRRQYAHLVRPVPILPSPHLRRAHNAVLATMARARVRQPVRHVLQATIAL